VVVFVFEKLHANMCLCYAIGSIFCLLEIVTVLYLNDLVICVFAVKSDFVILM
jgi:hypothetical protein